MKLRVHHFFDIIRDFGSGKEISPHPYGHSYHIIAEKIRNNPYVPVQLVIGCDDVCEGCNHKSNNQCTDTISHRKDFASKEEFNNHIDNRIMEVCKLNLQSFYTPIQLCNYTKTYINHAGYIYDGNDSDHTSQRIELVKRGLHYYLDKF